MASSAGSPCSAGRYFILPWPTPCSPVQVPSIASARCDRRSRKASTRSTSASSFMSTSSPTWKLPSPTWPTIGAESLLVGNVALGLGHAFGEPRNRNADVGRQRLRRRGEARAAPNRRRAAPATAACDPRPCVAQSNGPPPNSRAISPKRCDCSATPAVGAVKFQEQHRRFRQRELRIGIAGLHLQRVEQLDPRHRNAGLDGRGSSRCTPPRPTETDTRRRRSPPECRQPQRQFGDDAERAFRADDQRVRS